ncbi:Tat proofreading chaperone FdhE [Variovorax sp. PDC80]|jgi:FdhE protein|uniref:formate dehydrogenase accessory protein FdhE n=1 Tax=Variovorax sp. PDC80 TaxID=1882827 RepID=UPI0008E39B45|nr:formate dehydrogenase accessory protein FdhE [Variovorax sp. PDC80]SFO13382.1 Tat proofreading chaperone FdhE [Variovorax sp. PDC80]
MSSSPPIRTTRVLEPEQIAMQAGRQMPFLRLPVRAAAFSDRQLRLRQLAASHPMREYLIFIADLAQAQHQVLQDHAPVALPEAEALEAASRALKPPLPAFGWPRDPVWRAELRRLLGLFRARLSDGPARDTLDRVTAADDDWLEQQADRLSRRIMFGLDLAAAPLIAAGLQVYWTQLVLQVAQQHGENIFGRTDPGNLCPCCGSAPTASITRIGADEAGFRYLHCALCGTEWHYVRIKCTHCESTKGIHFESLTPEPGVALPATGAREGAVKAECCDTCGHYLKQIAMEKDPEVEPVADDLASVTLDLLVSENGHQRSGHNLMLLFGDPEIPDDGGGG